MYRRLLLHTASASVLMHCDSSFTTVSFAYQCCMHLAISLSPLCRSEFQVWTYYLHTTAMLASSSSLSHGAAVQHIKNTCTLQNRLTV